MTLPSIDRATKSIPIPFCHIHNRQAKIHSKAMKKLATTLIAISVAGCATSTKPIKASEATQVPNERILGFQLPSQNSGQIVFVRDKGLLGGGCYIAPYIDGKPVAKLDKGEKVTAIVTPGQHVLHAAGVAGGLCSNGSDSPGIRATQTQISPGDKVVYRISMSADPIFHSGTITVTPTTN